MVSVPLRGYGFEMLADSRFYGGIYHGVSVPLRGYGFEMLKDFYYLTNDDVWFPSPYGDMVLK